MKRLLRIQYASNLHLEHYDKVAFQPILKPVAPILALAGNLGEPGRRAYRDLFHYCSRNWDHVFVVAGDQELKHPYRTADDQMAICKAITAEWPNVHFLNRTRVDREGLTFLGVPLIQKIADRKWIRAELSECKGPTVILTHQLPVRDLMSDGMDYECVTDCTEFIKPPVVALISGLATASRQVFWVAPDLTLVAGGVNPYDGTNYCRERVIEVGAGAGFDCGPALQSRASPEQNSPTAQKQSDAYA